MEELLRFKDKFEKVLKQIPYPESPENLYQPIQYLLGLGGKRIRAASVLLTAHLYQGIESQAMNIACAIEIFHNFTLMHDDIMDNAPLRRGHATVHEKWGTNAAILSGDAMMVQAYSALSNLPDRLLPAILRQFNKTAIEVCEGQQMDMDFEKESTVSRADYLEMIRLKTAVLLGSSFALGGVAGNASDEEVMNLYSFGENLGIAFQIKDDFLDCFGESQKVGKQLGGDIKEGKKTFLFISLLEKLSESKKTEIVDLYKSENNKKVSLILDLFQKYNVDKAAKETIDSYTESALENLSKLNLSTGKKDILKNLATGLLGREY